MINKTTQKESLLRLKRIEGQIKGLSKMIEEERYCIDIISQIDAARRALEKVALIVMKRHIESCVVSSIREEGGKEKINELVASIDSFIS